MGIPPGTAQGILDELFLISRALRRSLAQPEEGRLLPGGISVLVNLESAGPCRQVDLACQIGISASAMSRHITELVADGYVLRNTDPSDGRAIRVEVSPTGLELLGRIRESRIRGLQEVLADWTVEDAEHAHQILNTLRSRLIDRDSRSAAPENHKHPHSSPSAPTQRSVTEGPEPESKESQEIDV
ncbi:MarR family winged helix-turn-helix transcriptional regulator [Nocardia sp. NBC_01329]|uniref:MarR family winged helix-turn-helix transcriptional regulator n=1 Tax=Nocardia sp. NBC_01329 TaxID=2903594 RepID=UPI002E0E67BE|nr:MarR family transcriptional regulator [Nocardia sp. NBC_01329]